MISYWNKKIRKLIFVRSKVSFLRGSTKVYCLILTLTRHCLRLSFIRPTMWFIVISLRKLHRFVLFNKDRLACHCCIRLPVVVKQTIKILKKKKKKKNTLHNKNVIPHNSRLFSVDDVCKFIWWRRTKLSAFTRVRFTRHTLRHEPRKFQLYFPECIPPLLLIAAFKSPTRSENENEPW